MDVRGGRLFVAAYANAVDATGGAYIFDVATDPARPTLLGHYVAPGSLGGDRSMEATEDGQWLLVGTETTTCAGHVNLVPPGLSLVDIRDPSRPVVHDFFPGSVHSVTTHVIDGAHIVWAVSSTQNLGNVFRIDTTLPKARLLPLGSHPISHDATAFDDPLLGHPILLTADGMRPMTIWDVSDPGNPVALGSWEPEDRGSPPNVKYYIHHAQVAILDGRRIVVVQSEDWRDYPSPFWVLDFTDLGSPRLLGSWANPAGLGAEGLRWSQHNPRLTPDGRLALSHYHAGVWTFDLSTPGSWAEPKPNGVFLPAEDVGWRPGPTHTNKPVRDRVCGGYGEFYLEDSPETFDVEWHGRYLYAADAATGLYVLEQVPLASG